MIKKSLLLLTAALGLTMSAYTHPLRWDAAFMSSRDLRKMNANRTDLDFLVTMSQVGLQLGDTYAVYPVRWDPAFMSNGYDLRMEWVFKALLVGERQGRYVNQLSYLEETRVKLGGRPCEYNQSLDLQLQPLLEIYRSASTGY